LQGSGTTSALTEYMAFDSKHSGARLRYYRLKQVDFDGAFNESKIIFVNCTNLASTETEITMYPNPTYDDLIILINQSSAGDVKINVVDVLGQIVFSQNYPVASGIQQIKINMKNFAPDLYHVVIESGNYRKTGKVVKQN